MLRDEPECVDSDAIAEFADVARRETALRRAVEIDQLREVRQHLSVDQRIRDAQFRAKRQRIDITSDLFFLRKTMDRGRDDNTLKRLLALEDRVDQAQHITDAL
jgi:hypothetical protein